MTIETKNKGKITINNMELLGNDPRTVIDRKLKAAGCPVEYKHPSMGWVEAQHNESDCTTIWWNIENMKPIKNNS